MRTAMIAAFALILLSGCTSPASPSTLADGHEEVTYRVAISSDAKTDEFRISMGAPTVMETTYPAAYRSLALVRPLSIEQISAGPAGPGSSFATMYASCAGETGFCVTAVAIDPNSGEPIRFFHSPLSVIKRSSLEDGSADSIFTTTRNDHSFWALSPLFLGEIWRHSNGTPKMLFGHPLTLEAAHEGSAIEISYRTSSKWHDLNQATNVSGSVSGTAILDDGPDPVSATLVETEAAHDHASTITYQFVRTEASGTITNWPKNSMSGASPLDQVSCGHGMQGPLLPGSRLPYADAFAPVQQDADYRSASAEADAILAAIRLPSSNQGDPLRATPRIWEFDVQVQGIMTEYRVEERSNLPGPIPQTPEYVLTAKEAISGDATTTALRDQQCVSWPALEARVSAYLEEIGADGYRQALVERLPADLSFRYVGDQLLPEAEAYALTIQPFVNDSSGEINTGPRMTFSLITGDLTRII